jgi:hypothetical protein
VLYPLSYGRLAASHACSESTDYPSLAHVTQAKAARIRAVPEKLLYLVQELDRLVA